MFVTKRTILRIASLGGAYLATLAVLGVSTTASGTPAGDRYVHSAICHYKFDNVGLGLDNSAALHNLQSSPTRIVYCPMTSDDALQTEDVLSMDVWGEEGDDGATSRACGIQPESASCAASKAWVGGPGVVASDVLTTGWWNGEGFDYVKHELTPGSTLIGMALDGP